MAKLSEQLKGEEIQSRVTRTQKVAQKQQIERERKSFENLKARATEKQEEFNKVSSIDEYEQKYNLLDPKLKQFFDTPQELRTQKTERIAETKTDIQERHTYADQKIIDAKTRLDKKIKSAQAIYIRDKRRGKEDAREKFNAKENKYEDEYDETEKRWEGYKKGLDKGMQELNQNKDISFDDIKEYARDLGRYEESKEEARNEKKAFDRNQKLERKRLEEAGYKPQVIEKSFKGKPTAVQIGFYNPKTKDWVKGAEYKVSGKVDVSKMKKLGYSKPQQREIEFGGKTYGFQSRVGVYKAPSGEIVTPYQRTGVTEAQLIKQQQDTAFKEWQSKPKDTYVPFKIMSNKDLPVGYGGQQTVSTSPTNIAVSEKDYYRDVKTFDFGAGKIIKGTKAGFGWVDERTHLDFDISGTPTMPKISLFKFGKVDKPTIAEKYIEKFAVSQDTKAQEDLQKAIGIKKYTTAETEEETKAQKEYQAKFEKEYQKDLIYDNITFEEATKKFAESEEAKIIQKKYSESWNEKYKELSQDVSLGKKFIYGTQVVGHKTLSSGARIIKSPTKTALTVGAVYTGLKALGQLNKIKYFGGATSVGLTSYGLYKGFSPTSTVGEAGSGFVTAIISGATLGYGSYRYLRSPHKVATLKIPSPEKTLKTYPVGKDIKVITDKGVVNKIIYENQKLSQIGSAGRRTIWTTKARHLLEKYTKIKTAPIYRGIPTKQLSKQYNLGKITYKTKSGYQKMYGIMRKYGGFTDYQAKVSLRYTAPSLKNIYLSRGDLTIKGTKAVGEFEYSTEKPVITIDKKLGIKTRGGKTIKDIYNVERELITIEKAGKTTRYALEGKTHVATSLKKGDLFKFTDVDYSLSAGVSKATKTFKGYEYVGKDTLGFDVLKKGGYKDIYSATMTKKIIPMDKIVTDTSRTTLFNRIVDIRGKKTGLIQPATIKKTSLSSTFADDIIQQTKKIPSTDVSKIIDKLDDVSAKTFSSPSVSKYYGTGQYEQTMGGQQLKSPVIHEPTKIIQLKDIIKVKRFNVLKNLQMGQFASAKIATGFKSDIKLNSNLKLINNLKVMMKENVMMKTQVAQTPALKTSPALKSQLQTSLNITPISLTTPMSPITKLPSIPKTTPPKMTPFALPFLKAKISKMTKKKVSKSIYQKAYLPDFTSRALGLKAETLTEKQAQKRLNKILTGLEIKRSVKVKW